MAIKIFLDTNIIIDLLDSQRKSHSEARSLFKLIEENEVMAFISESVVTTTDYILQKFLSKNQRTDFFTEVSRSVQVLPCNNTILDKALISEFSDLEDLILYQIALENKLDYFITNDNNLLKMNSLSQLPIIQARKFLDLVIRT